MTVLHYEVVAPAGDAPTQWLAFTHGIFGSGGNWRSVARKFLDAAPAWGAVLIDLRGHGKSPTGDAPHTLAACALDLVETLHQLRAQGLNVVGLSAHSFGGKVALALSNIASERLAPLHRFILDSTPSARPDAWQPPLHIVPTVLRLLESLPATWPSRDAFVAAVVDAGQPREIAQWLGISVQPRNDQYALRLDLAVVRALLDDYFAQDYWSCLVDHRAPIDFVVASRGNTLSADDMARLELAPPHVHATVLDARHWLNVDAPGPLVDLLVERLVA